MKKQTACPSHKYLTTFGRRIRKGLFLSVFMLTGVAAQLTAAPESENNLRHFQQTITVTGTVRDMNGSPVPGASITVKGTKQGTTTNSDGAFSIAVPSEQSVLVVEHTGYVSQEFRVGSQRALDVVLNIKNTSLDSVVVIGYGTARKSDLTGSVGGVKQATLAERPAPSLAQGLAGRIAGVQVNSNSGRPGGRNNVRIRGFSSINTSNNPLYVIDGVAMPVGIQVQATNAIDYINPDDIVSVEVLKDASSTAIYGARGANGVILVTTRRGRNNTPGRVSYNGQFSTNTLGPNPYEVLNAQQYLDVEDLAYANMAKFDPAGWAAGKYTSRNPALTRTDPRVFDANGKPKYDTDWMEESIQHKLSQNHDLSFTGGGSTGSYSIGLGYRDDQGLLLNSFLRRYSARVAADEQVKKWLKVGVTLSYNNQEENIVDQDYQVMRNIAEGLPFQPVKYDDGRWSWSGDYPFAEPFWNPVQLLTERKFIVKSQTTMGSIYSDIDFTKDLQMRTVLGANVLNQEIDQAVSRGLQPSTSGGASINNSKETFWSLENYFTYTKRIGTDHDLKALLGLSWQHQDFNSSAVGIQNFSTDYFQYNNLGAGSFNPTYGSGRSSFAFNSYFGRVNYAFKNKYLVTVTGRADGSSRFGDNHKYAFFPSAALAWRVSDEAFLQNNKLISHLKLRTSYGLTGNSEIPPYTSLSVLSSGYVGILGDARVGGTGLGRLANPDLRWEKTAQFDFGFELGMFNNRLNLEADLYYRKTTDMLLDAPVARTSGYATIRKNVGSMENKGLELTLNALVISQKNFSWNTAFNVSFNRNKVLSLATPADIFGVGGPGFTNQTNIIRVGEPVGAYWGLVRLGTWSEAEAAEAAKYTSYRNGLTLLPGDIKYLDVNGDYVINDADRMIIGNGYPNAYGGWANNLRFKDWEFILELQYSFGNDILDQTKHSSEDRQSLANSYKSVLNAWTPQNQNTPIAQIRDTRAGYVTNVDSHWVEDGSFIRGKNILLAYNFKGTMLERIHISKLRLFASVQNFFLITKYPNGDPEITLNTFGNESNRVFAQGQNFHAYPKSTVWMFGVSVGF
ncbi:TonB-dependent receptor [Pollutibacter soli]|uniref:SusC/RagA family TonB-linked outer membrane protein n=1 Tax=Pollutibacter soli TaxID=3034157 RepID=UPI0030135029